MAESKIDSVAPGYQRMADTHWDLITALEGGTPAMRQASRKGGGGAYWVGLPGAGGDADFLPALEKEEPADWEKRLQMTFLHPGFSKGVTRISAKPFGKKLVVHEEEKLDPRLRALIDDTDGQGKSLHALARELMQDGWSRGLFHIGVDLPRPSKAATSRQDELTLKPRIFRIKPVNLINWPHEIDSNGNIKLQQIRFRENATVVDRWDMKEVERIRVWNADRTWSIHEKRKTGESEESERWEEVDGGALTFPDGIPLITRYFNQTGFMEAESPFADVAWLNLAHWQSSSRQRWYLDFARFSFLFGRGIGKNEMQGKVVLSPQTLLTAQNPQAELMVVEHQGHAIESGQNDLDDLERRMDEASLKPMQTKGGTPTAAARWLDEASVSCDAAACVMEVETALTDALHMAGRWIGKVVPDEVEVKLPGDVLMRRNAEDMEHVFGAYDRGAMDDLTLLQEMQDRGIVGDRISPEEILKRMAEQKPDSDATLEGVGGSRRMLVTLQRKGLIAADADVDAILDQMDGMEAA